MGKRWQIQFAQSLRPGDQVRFGKQTEAFILRGPRIEPAAESAPYDTEYLMFDLVDHKGEQFSHVFGRGEKIRVFR